MELLQALGAGELVHRAHPQPVHCQPVYCLLVSMPFQGSLLHLHHTCIFIPDGIWAFFSS